MENFFADITVVVPCVNHNVYHFSFLCSFNRYR